MDETTIWQGVIALCVIVGAIAAFRVFQIGRNESEIQQRSSALSGEIKPKEEPLSSKKSKNITLQMGGNYYVDAREKFEKGIAQIPIQTSDNNPPIVLKLIDDKLFITSTFNSYDGKISAVMKDNEWQINPNNYFKRNYDDQAIEVVDSHGIKFQIEFLNDSTILFRGTHILNGGFVIFSSTTGQDMGQFPLQKLVEMNNDLPFIFSYPEAQYFGERAKK